MGHCLILISCSNHKETGGEKEYSSEDSILHMLNSKTREAIRNKRKEIFNLIKEGKIEDLLRDEGNRRKCAYNIKLQNGPDIAMEYHNHANNDYWPAYKRYKDGKYFANASEDVPDVFEKALSQGYHTLIVSGLYGLITLREPIQVYACHLDDAIIPSGKVSDVELSKEIKARVSDLWKGLIDEALFQYVHYHNEHDDHKISKVIDLLSEYSYQRVINWEKLEEECKDIEIYHRVVHKIREPKFLPELGRYYKDEITAEGDDFKTPLTIGRGDVYFTEKLQPDPFYEEELKRLMTNTVWEKLDKISREELIQAENLYHKFMARDVKIHDKADSNLHYFIAVEKELQVIFGEINKKDNSRGLGTIGNYLYHLKYGNLKGRLLPNRTKILEHLPEVHEIRNNACHPKGITKAELIRTREIILGNKGNKGFLSMLVDVKSFKNPH